MTGLPLAPTINEIVYNRPEPAERRKAEEALGKLRAERLNPQPSLFI